MDRDLLERYLGQGLSLEQVGILVDRDPSTVGYWVRKHGLVANGRSKHASRGSLIREELEQLVGRRMTIAEIANALDRSPGTIRYWLGKWGLETKSRRGPRPAIPRAVVEQAIRNGSRTLVGDCRHHGETIFVIENSGRVRCRQCRMERVYVRRRKVKRILVEEAGGRCMVCGYDRFAGALQFHHPDPAAKRFSVSRYGATLGIDVLRSEASKCVLLCANCHAEIEHGAAELPVK